MLKRLTIQVKPNSKTSQIEVVSDAELKVKVNASPIDGRANERLLEILADYFDIPKSKIQVIRGLKSKKKTVEIDLTK